MPFEKVDKVLTECGAGQQRIRKLPAHVVVYPLLAAALSEECGYLAGWAKLTSALGSLPIPKLTGTALWHARARLGVRPLRGPAQKSAPPVPAVPGCWSSPSTAPTSMSSMTPRPRPPGQDLQPVRRLQLPPDPGGSGRLAAPAPSSTRSSAPRTRGGTSHGKRLTRSLHLGMIVLLDRGFSANALLEAVADTGAAFRSRLSVARKPPVLSDRLRRDRAHGPTGVV